MAYQTPISEPQSVSAAHIFISYRSRPPDSDLAEEFHQALTQAGHQVFMAAASIELGDNWSSRIDQGLERCDYFVLLLSPQSAASEMVTEEVRRARELRDTRGTGTPKILPIRVNFPIDAPLNYDLRGYLNPIQQTFWESPNDTPEVLQKILAVIARGASLTVAQTEGDNTADPMAAEAPESLMESPMEPPMERPDAPPVPVAPPELPEGQVEMASQYYVERQPIEANCYETIARPGALIRIKAPRQMGKSSLMSRILRHADQQGYLTVPLSFQLADASIVSDLDRFLKWFCASVGRRLRSPHKPNQIWDDIFGSKDNCTAYFEEYILPEISAPLVLGLDEVDMVFDHPPVAADFMGLLRAWHESAKVNDLWKKLRLVVVHSTEVYIPMNINQSPFNVGLPIELPEFTTKQVQDLAQRHGLTWGESETAQLMAMVGGHPYLVRVALYALARQETALPELLETAPTEAGPYGDHLRRHLWNLEQRGEMAEATKRVMASKYPERLEPIQAFQLHSMGIVRLRGNEVEPRCDLYRQYFGDRLTIRKF
ncbi:MAG: AAA-like domain-containing protein [Cyanobacteria bacterium P01_F01_bin.150]